MSRAERPLVVAIDGPAASGKSSTARMVAEQIGAQHVDSGALYRAVTAARLRAARLSALDDPESWTEASVLASAARVALCPGPTTFVACIDGEPSEDEIRGTPVTALVSLVAKMTHVRDWVNGHLREVALAHDLVVDGRDMGTAVFPDALVKVWLVALPSERARRRLVQRTGREPAPAELATETAELERRDFRDSRQTQPAPDAVWVDTTGITQAEQVARVVELAKRARR